MLGILGTPYDRFRLAETLFERRDYRDAAMVLEGLITDASADDQQLHGLGAARLLLARAYFHSAQLNKAEQTLRALVADDPADGYAVLLLGRTLERASRTDEARGVLARAASMGLCSPR